MIKLFVSLPGLLKAVSDRSVSALDLRVGMYYIPDLSGNLDGTLCKDRLASLVHDEARSVVEADGTANVVYDVLCAAFDDGRAHNRRRSGVCDPGINVLLERCDFDPIDASHPFDMTYLQSRIDEMGIEIEVID